MSTTSPAVALRADGGEREQPLVVVEGAAAPQRSQVWVEVPGAAPLPLQVWQRRVLGHVDRGGDAAHGVLEGQVHLGLDVGAPLGPGPRRRPPATAPEEAAEQVAQVAHVLHPEGAAAGPKPPARPKPPAIGPRRRTSSYSLRLAGSPRTS